MKRFQALLPWVAAFLGIAFSAYVFYPGYLTWDSAYQWWQVRHHVVDTAHPPIMVWVWGLTNHLLPGPGGYFLLQTCLYWLSLALFISSLRLSGLWQALLVLVLGFWPPLWGLSVHLWKDVGTLSFFCLAAACLARDLVRPHPAWLAGAFVAIVLASMYRHNAIAAALPLMIYGFACHYKPHPPGTSLGNTSLGKFRTLLYGVFAFGLVQLVVLLPNYVLKLHSEPLWPQQALWDLAAVSVEEDRMLIPPEWTDPSLTMDVVRRDFNPVFSALLFTGHLIKLNPYQSMSEHDFKVLRNAWLLLPFEYPQAYWEHRFRVTETLLGWQHDPANASLVFDTRITEFKDNPKIMPRAVAARAQLELAANTFSRSALFQGGWYLLFSVLILGAAIWRRQKLMGALACSGLFYVLPLLVLAPSSDFRYLGWMLQASLLAVLAPFITPGITPGITPVTSSAGTKK